MSEVMECGEKRRREGGREGGREDRAYLGSGFPLFEHFKAFAVSFSLRGGHLGREGGREGGKGGDKEKRKR